jgi:ubiquinone/menaquinone biosynthesis C-methylase UbiE
VEAQPRGLVAAETADLAMIPKPAHLGPRFASQFEDESVARVYHTRPPYPADVFDILEGLMSPGRRAVLDLGCGTGDVALGLASRVDHIDAIDPSRAMLRVAMDRQCDTHSSLNWIEKTAEAFQPRVQYSLIVAGESLHWMDWEIVLPRAAEALTPGAFLAIVAGRRIADIPWAAELDGLVSEFSTNRDYRPYDLIEELTTRGLFNEVGRRTTRPIAFAQSCENYIESFHTRNGLSRARMTPQAAAMFDEGLRRIVERSCPDGIVQGEIAANVVWGSPLLSTERVRSRELSGRDGV